MLNYSFNELSCQHLNEKKHLRHFYDDTILDPSIVQSKNRKKIILIFYNLKK